MTDLKLAHSDPEKQFWDQLDGHTAGMLGLEGVSQHPQPMAHFIDKTEKRLYFFVAKDSDMVRVLKPGATARYLFISTSHDYHASVKGALTVSNDPAKIDEYWSPVVEAWFDGKNDPNMVLLALDLHDAAVWASTNSTIRFGWEVAKANMAEDHEPDVGVTNHINFLKAA